MTTAADVADTERTVCIPTGLATARPVMARLPELRLTRSFTVTIPDAPCERAVSWWSGYCSHCHASSTIRRNMLAFDTSGRFPR